MERILLDNSPSQLKFVRPLTNKIEIINQGNSCNDDTDLVKKKNEEGGPIQPLGSARPIELMLSPYCRYKIQTMVIKLGKNGCLTARKPTYIVTNHLTLVVNWSPITFGRIKFQLYIDIYNI